MQEMYTPWSLECCNTAFSPADLSVLQRHVICSKITDFSNDIEFGKNIFNNIYTTCLDNNYGTNSNSLKKIAIFKLINFDPKITLSFLYTKQK